jgi:mRNA interferase MazF
MPAEVPPLVLHAGQIVLADWRGDALPKEPNKRRPAVVVEDDGLFAPAYPNAILVPLTEDAALVIPDLSVAITPTPDNGCSKPCWAVSHLVATTSKARLSATRSRITAEQLTAIRRQIILAVGGEG